MKIKKPTNQRTHRIMIKVFTKGKPKMSSDGRILYPVVWHEVAEVNLGSLKNPNKKILEVKIEPIEYEHERRENRDVFWG